MVNDQNRINGVGIDAHPFSDAVEGVALFSTTPTFLAAQAMVGGVIATKVGDRRFQAGDWILTDNPPTHAWPVNDQVFRSTYKRVGEPPTGSLPVSAAPALVRAAETKTKVQQKSAKARETAKAAGTAKPRRSRPMATPRTATPPGEPGQEVPAGKIADSSSLGLPSGPDPT